MAQPALHLGIRHIQDIFRANERRLYHWADNKAVPADNNLAERDSRPSVIARKVSFGSVTDAGAEVRSILDHDRGNHQEARRGAGDSDKAYLGSSCLRSERGSISNFVSLVKTSVI